jgi:chromosome segregation protein
MLPLDALIPPEPLSVKPTDGVVGLAADLVQAQPEYRPAVDLLLGHTIIVDDRKTARRVLTGLPQSARAVTLQGEIFYASGPVMSGQMGGASTLSRPRQRRELQAQIEATQKQLNVAVDAIEKLDQTLNSRIGDERNLVSMLDQARREAEATERRRGEVSLEVTQARRQAEWQRAQQSNLRDALQHGKPNHARW